MTATTCINVAGDPAANGRWYPDDNTGSHHSHQRSGKPARQPPVDRPTVTLTATTCINVAGNLAANGRCYPDENTGSHHLHQRSGKLACQRRDHPCGPVRAHVHLHQRSGKPARQPSLTDTPNADTQKRIRAIRTSENFTLRPTQADFVRLEVAEILAGRVSGMPAGSSGPFA
jgi:hypothetical protein